MYPVIRMAKEIFVHRNAPALGLFDVHVGHHICWPHDLDPWIELNNGRALTLYDMGRVILFRRTGLADVMRAKGWVGTVAGSSVRYRRRVRVFDRLEMRSRLTGWDDRFFYIEQSLWKDGDCTSHGLFRNAVTGSEGLVPMPTAAGMLDAESPPLPNWIRAWAAAEAERPWPPMQDDVRPAA